MEKQNPLEANLSTFLVFSFWDSETKVSRVLVRVCLGKATPSVDTV